MPTRDICPPPEGAARQGEDVRHREELAAKTSTCGQDLSTSQAPMHASTGQPRPLHTRELASRYWPPAMVVDAASRLLAGSARPSPTLRVFAAGSTQPPMSSQSLSVRPGHAQPAPPRAANVPHASTSPVAMRPCG
ncbi:hypothetical protein Dimus_001242 [Dionaea muscipula]